MPVTWVILVLSTALLRRDEEDKQLHTVRILHGDLEEGISNNSNRQFSAKSMYWLLKFLSLLEFKCVFFIIIWLRNNQ